MKTIKEGFLRKNLGLGKEELIRRWLDKYCYINGKYTINKDLIIDVDGGVDLIKYEEKQLPDYIQFRKVTKYFYINNCPKLESLEGCPEEVGWDFSCSGCSKLTSLEGCPKKVGWDFYCYNCGKQFTENDVEKYCKVTGKING